MSPPKRPSHLNDASASGRPYPWKAACEWCYVKYDTELSDAMEPKRWCSLKCEKEDTYLEERAKYSE